MKLPEFIMVFLLGMLAATGMTFIWLSTELTSAVDTGLIGIRGVTYALTPLAQ